MQELVGRYSRYLTRTGIWGKKGDLMDVDMKMYLSGEKLYGDDFSLEQLKKWVEEEAEGYSGLVREAEAAYTYVYHELNKMHGFQYVKLPQKCIALGVGSANCQEFYPILPYLSHITSLEPSNHFSTDKVGGVPVLHVKPSVDGKMPFPDDHFDVITCFGVLHHIANVTFTIAECFRVLKPGGFMFLREPVVSMGDWRRPRKGLTKNERGIPYALFINMVKRHNYTIVRLTQFDFAPLGRLLSYFGVSTFSHRSTTVLDYALSQIFAFNKKYHRVTRLEKFGPASVYMCLLKNQFSSGSKFA
ncbi:MAG: class I SAM-dependent methyltransferase [Nitrospira sp.]|nr:MAG: class I SAM-dependent methyltransferase [Nitrospira sp.]